MLYRFYRTPALTAGKTRRLKRQAEGIADHDVGEVMTERCFYVETTELLDDEDLSRLKWLLSETYQPDQFAEESFLSKFETVIEVGPNLRFATPFCARAVQSFRDCGIKGVSRIEESRRYGFEVHLNGSTTKIAATLFDRMNEMVYLEPLTNLDPPERPPRELPCELEPDGSIPLLEQGEELLRAFNKCWGLALDEFDLARCLYLFNVILGRNPKPSELRQFSVSGAEHTRHGFWRGKYFIDGIEVPDSLMDIVEAAWEANPGRSVIAFHDDASALRGHGFVNMFVPALPGNPSPIQIKRLLYHLTFTAETHNYPSGISAYPGAATGTGGRIRDNLAVGRGGLMIAGIAGYLVGNIRIPGYIQPWEEGAWVHPPELMSPLDILIQASNGASDYGNCIGEPVVLGILRSLGMELPDGYRSWFKPIVYVAGFGYLDDRHLEKLEAQIGWLIVYLGGPIYGVGIGGGAASSMGQGENLEELDYQGVQRGDAAMEQPDVRVIRACSELGDENPLEAVGDSGAGGLANWITERMHPAGGIVNLRSIPIADPTLEVDEAWVAEAQEIMGVLVRSENFDRLKAIADREQCPCYIVGVITGNGWAVLHDPNDGSKPVELPLDQILGKLPQKEFRDTRIAPVREQLVLPDRLSVHEALMRVLRHPSVCSRRFLTDKVDRSVTGLIAQQQCIGPHQMPLADFAIIAQSFIDLCGGALSLGEQPNKGLISPAAMARLAVAEAILNMAGVKITALGDIRCSANWMWAAKQPGELANLLDAAYALKDILIALGMAIDGGKDSSSMYTLMRGPDGQMQIVKAPGELVIGAYAPVEDITRKVTAALLPSQQLLYLDLSPASKHLGGTILAQCFAQAGNDCADVEDVSLLKRMFEAMQELVAHGLITAVHDVSDGGFLTCVLEMAFAGGVGLKVQVKSSHDALTAMFAEEPGLVIACEPDKLAQVQATLEAAEVPTVAIGSSREAGDDRVEVSFNGEVVIADEMQALRAIWEETSFRLDELQCEPECVAAEEAANRKLAGEPFYHLTFVPMRTPDDLLEATEKPKVAVLRDVCTNGDREMIAALYLAGFEVWDITMTDLKEGRATLDDFIGLVFPGGFSRGDVLDSAKGWAGVIRFNPQVREQFDRFFKRPETWSLGVCNGAQLMMLLGWVPYKGLAMKSQPRFVRNIAERFQSRWVRVKVMPTTSILFKDMVGSVLGVWVAHGEGQLVVPEEGMLDQMIAEGLVPLCFVDAEGNPTVAYSFCPNGSPLGATAVCSLDGRHTAMMPHPERAFLPWQEGYTPEGWHYDVGAWLRIFQNAYAHSVRKMEEQELAA